MNFSLYLLIVHKIFIYFHQSVNKYKHEINTFLKFRPLISHASCIDMGPNYTYVRSTSTVIKIPVFMYQQIYIIFTLHVRLCRLTTEQNVFLAKQIKTNRIEPSIILNNVCDSYLSIQFCILVHYVFTLNRRLMCFKRKCFVFI